MGFWGRLGTGLATGGMSELSGAYPAYSAGKSLANGGTFGDAGKAAAGGNEFAQVGNWSGWDGLKTWLMGGKATEGMASAPQTADYQRNYLQGMLGRQAPMMDASQQGQFRGQQQQLADRLNLVAQGKAPGAGEMAVNRQVGQATAAQLAQAQMARGANAALANRTAARNNAGLGVAGAGQAAMAQLQDQSAANAHLGQLLGTARAQDIGIAQGNQGAQMQQQQLQLQALAQMLGVDVAQLNQDLAKRGLAMQDQGILPSLLQIGGSIGAAYAGAPPASGAAVGQQVGKSV